MAYRLVTLRVNVTFLNSPLDTFTIRSFWKTRDQPGDVNSALLKTSVNESYGVGIGYWSICSRGFTVTLQFPQILTPLWVLGACTAGTAPALASAEEIVPCLCNPSHCSSDPSHHPSAATLSYTNGSSLACTNWEMASPAPSSLLVVLLIKQTPALNTALYFTYWLLHPGRSVACRSSVQFMLIYCHFLPISRRPSPSVTINSNGKQVCWKVTVTGRQPKTPSLSFLGHRNSKCVSFRLILEIFLWYTPWDTLHRLPGVMPCGLLSQ